MKSIRHLATVIITLVLAVEATYAQEEIYLPSGAPLKSLFTTMKNQCLSGKLKPLKVEFDSTTQLVYRQTFPANRTEFKMPGNITITMGVTQKKITRLEATLTNKALFSAIKSQTDKAYSYSKSVNEGYIYFDNSVAKVSIPHHIEEYGFPHGTGAILTKRSEKSYSYSFAPVFQCLLSAASIPSDTINYIINYPDALPFGRNIAKLNLERSKYAEMSPNTYRLPLKEIFDGKRAGLYMEALALEVGEKLTGKRIGMRRLLKPEEAQIQTRDIISFNVQTNYEHQLTGMKAAFRFRTTYEAIHSDLASLGYILNEVDINEAKLKFYFSKENNLCLILFAAEPMETRGTRGVYNIQALNYPLGKVLYELLCFHKSQLINH